MGSARADDTATSDGEPALYELVDAATQRLQTADPVAATKWLNGGPITDPDRVRQVLATVATAAQSVSLPTDYVISIFTDQIDVTESPDCVVGLDAAKSAVAGARELDPLYRRALDAATRSYCG